jgi:hypothetical protein
MSDQQGPDAALEAVRSAIDDATETILEILKAERKDTAGGARLPVWSGLRLAYALGQLTDEQRKALLVGAQLRDDGRNLLAGLLDVVEPSQEP